MKIPVDRSNPQDKVLLQVRKRGGFSDRNGIKKENTEIQLYEFDTRTRNVIYNTINSLYYSFYPPKQYFDIKQEFIRSVFTDVYMQPIEHDGLFTDATLFHYIKNTVTNDSYDSVLTLIEHIAQHWEREKRRHYWQGESFYVLFNGVFEKEYVGYRFVGEIITNITDQIEIDSIDEALCSPYKEVNNHLEKALEYFSDRKKPDYENSIKESISAVEAMCEIITGIKGKGSELSKTLDKLDNSGVNIHPALNIAFNKLFAYTNDANGIRHAGDIGGPSSTFEEAKFMLVSCSAFINYLKGLQAKIK